MSVSQKLRGLKREDIVVSEYAERRARFRQVDLEEVFDNLLNPVRLQWAEKQVIDNDERYDCYFVYKHRTLRCIVKLENDVKVRIINVIKPRKWPI